MRPKKYTSEGLILARRNYSEADRILVVYSKNYGKISMIAKGVRKLSSRKRGSLEIFSLVNFSASKGKGLDFMTEVETIDSFQKVRSNLKKVSVAYYLMEVIGRITKEDEENQELFSLGINYIKKLDDAEDLKKIRKEFVENILILLGYWPEGKKLEHPDSYLQEVVEREINSFRIGKKLLSHKQV